MKLHEYQSKELFEQAGIPVPKGAIANTEDEAKAAAQSLPKGKLVVKAQVLTGGRGKAGGVKLVNSIMDATKVAKDLLGKQLVTVQSGPDGVTVKTVLITEAVEIERELYMGMVVDRSKGMVVAMASTEGGVEIEKVAAETPEKIHKAWFHPSRGLLPFQAMRMAAALKLSGAEALQAVNIFMKAATLFATKDASLVEINPLVLTKDGNMMAIDAKVTIDDNALFRHKDLDEIRDTSEDDPNEIEAAKFGLNYIKLDGSIGCMVNGAGLAMATMDTIALYGAQPANFLDVGGGATVENVAAAFRILLGDPDVKAVLVNIFGGIMRCDVIAQGIVDAAKQVNVDRPLVVRLNGTNAELGKKILADSGLDLIRADTIDEAAQAVVAQVQG